MKKTGFKETGRMLRKITPEIEAKLDRANKYNADQIADLAKVLIPKRTGLSAASIRTIAAENGGQIVDFGPKAKVIEGRNAPRPFVNPALKATSGQRKARNRKAIRDAVKGVK